MPQFAAPRNRFRLFLPFSESLASLTARLYTVFYRIFTTEGRRVMDRGFIGWIIIGAVAGVVGKLIMPGKDPGGFIVTILLGIAGALLAGFIGQAVGFYSAGEGAGWIGATVGAIALLAIYRMVKSRSA
jgi:uncharacterized membrane protein YeaQ/YmgE (transglycosylase-associated protein family)